MLDIDGISAGYSKIPVLDRVSIHVAEGEFVAVVGPNGAGKTTLFKTISGLLKPTAGSIRFGDINLLETAPSRRAHLGIAHVPEGRHVFPSLTVMENLELGAYTTSGRLNWASNLERIFELFPVLPIAASNSPAHFPAVSSRCWRSGAGWRRHRSSSCLMSPQWAWHPPSQISFSND